MSNREEGNSPSISRMPRRTGTFCLPSPHRAPTITTEALLGGRPNPFPLIEDVQRAHALLPVATFWIPLSYEKAGEIDQLHAIFSHEMVHLILGEAITSFLVNCLIQGQFLTFFDELLRQQQPRRWLALPTLTEPTGYFVKAQDALEAVGREMEFIHELMATTIVRILCDHDLMLLAIPIMRQTQRFADSHGLGNITGATDYKDPSLKDKLAIARIAPGMADYLLPLDSENVLAYYQDRFTGEGDFMVMHERLLEAWRRVTANLRPEGDENSVALIDLLLKLAKYPFNLALSDELLARLTRTKAYRDSLNPMAAFVGQLQGRFHARLELMLDAIETGSAISSAARWHYYLSSILPNFDREFHGWRSLASFVYNIWGPQSNAALTFAHHFSEPYEMLWLNQAPPINPLLIDAAQPVDSEHRQLVKNALNLILGLEAMRQAVVAGQGLPCICTPEMQERCWIRIALARLWFSTYPAPDWEESFAYHWRRPLCM